MWSPAVAAVRVKEFLRYAPVNVRRKEGFAAGATAWFDEALSQGRCRLEYSLVSVGLARRLRRTLRYYSPVPVTAKKF